MTVGSPPSLSCQPLPALSTHAACIPMALAPTISNGFPLTSHISSSWPTFLVHCARYLYTSGAGLNERTKSTVMMSLKMDAYGDSSSDLYTEFESMVFVPFEKTTHSMLACDESFFSAGSTSEKMGRESYARMRPSMLESSSSRLCSVKACSKDFRVTSEKGSYFPVARR